MKKKIMFFIFIILMIVIIAFTKNGVRNDELLVDKFVREVYAVNSMGRYSLYLEALDSNIEGEELQKKLKEIYCKNIMDYCEEQVVDVYWANSPMDLDIHFLEQNCYLEIDDIVIEQNGDEFVWNTDVIVKSEDGTEMKKFKQSGSVRMSDDGKLENIFFDNITDLFNYGKS